MLTRLIIPKMRRFSSRLLRTPPVFSFSTSISSIHHIPNYSKILDNLFDLSEAQTVLNHMDDLSIYQQLFLTSHLLTSQVHSSTIWIPSLLTQEILSFDRVSSILTRLTVKIDDLSLQQLHDLAHLATVTGDADIARQVLERLPATLPKVACDHSLDLLIKAISLVLSLDPALLGRLRELMGRSDTQELRPRLSRLPGSDWTVAMLHLACLLESEFVAPLPMEMTQQVLDNLARLSPFAMMRFVTIIGNELVAEAQAKTVEEMPFYEYLARRSQTRRFMRESLELYPVLEVVDSFRPPEGFFRQESDPRISQILGRCLEVVSDPLMEKLPQLRNLLSNIALQFLIGNFSKHLHHVALLPLCRASTFLDKVNLHQLLFEFGNYFVFAENLLRGHSAQLGVLGVDLEVDLTRQVKHTIYADLKPENARRSLVHLEHALANRSSSKSDLQTMCVLFESMFGVSFGVFFFVRDLTQLQPGDPQLGDALRLAESLIEVVSKVGVGMLDAVKGMSVSQRLVRLKRSAKGFGEKEQEMQKIKVEKKEQEEVLRRLQKALEVYRDDMARVLDIQNDDESDDEELAMGGGSKRYPNLLGLYMKSK